MSDGPDRPWERERDSKIITAPLRPPPAVERPPTPKGKRTVVIALGLVVLIILFLIISSAIRASTEANVPVEQEPAELTACDEVLAKVEIVQQRHYDSHPAFADGFSYTSPGADATLADEEAKWADLIEPIYFGCDGADDLWDSVQRYPAIAGMISYQGLDLVKERELFFGSYCSGREDTPSCAGA